jgi:hypothetical protein
MPSVNRRVLWLYVACKIIPYAGPLFGLGPCGTGVSSFGRVVYCVRPLIFLNENLCTFWKNYMDILSILSLCINLLLVIDRINLIEHN